MTNHRKLQILVDRKDNQIENSINMKKQRFVECDRPGAAGRRRPIRIT
jgi:hypothetical protein